MEVVTLKNTAVAIKTSVEEIEAIGGHGICDSCCQLATEGYIIGVLGSRWNCPECTKKFEKRHYYEEDREYEELSIQRWLNILKKGGII